MARVNKPDCVRGSVIECQNQVLHENLRVTGTSFNIHYASDRVPEESRPGLWKSQSAVRQSQVV